MKTLISIFFSLMSLCLFLIGLLSSLGYFNLDFPEYLSLVNPSSILLILGGVFFQLFVSYPISQIGKAFNDIFSKIYTNRFEYLHRKELLEKVLTWQKSYQVAKQNIWSDQKSKNVDKFEFFVFELLETNYNIEEFEELTESKFSKLDRDVIQSQKIFQTLASSSPAFGMLGTIIGLIVMFQNFDNEMALAKGIGLALMTTLYGIFLAQFIWIPAGKRLNQFHVDLKFNYEIIVEGAKLILKEKSSLFIQDYLKAKIQTNEK
ncbi:MotA/TolQ/ExbB proton channel family protein [uncultured Algoriphagus sp.]|uniref:motility protein A n=1 Tax=uncultured Algoriphagus sp. TaxID=417365 RepID=UPI0025933167|nr:MotA/TolQ/ExbB proton channel family protein [uncultured Algoriphagus sp.]